MLTCILHVSMLNVLVCLKLSIQRYCKQNIYIQLDTEIAAGWMWHIWSSNGRYIFLLHGHTHIHPHITVQLGTHGIYCMSVCPLLHWSSWASISSPLKGYFGKVLIWIKGLRIMGVACGADCEFPWGKFVIFYIKLHEKNLTWLDTHRNSGPSRSMK